NTVARTVSARRESLVTRSGESANGTVGNVAMMSGKVFDSPGPRSKKATGFSGAVTRSIATLTGLPVSFTTSMVVFQSTPGPIIVPTTGTITFDTAYCASALTANDRTARSRRNLIRQIRRF